MTAPRRTQRLLSANAKVVIVSAASLLTALVLVFSSGSMSSQACQACHSEVATDHALSAHGSLECSRCHRASGLVGVVDLRVRMLGMLSGTLGGQARSASVVDSSRCLECHEELLEITVEVDGLRMSHAEPVNAGFSCSECHGQGFHPAVRQAAGRIDMGECLRCHVVSVASADCETCHYRPVSRSYRLSSGTFAKTHGSEWRTLHGMGDLNTCGACHTVARCSSCHGTPLPHGFTWLDSHGEESTIGDAKCAQCHSVAYCDSCHGLDMPHPTGFRNEHRLVAQNMTDDTCISCHDQRACDRCHVLHTHPGLPTEKVAELRKKAGLSD